MSKSLRTVGLFSATALAAVMGTGVAHADSANPQMTGAVEQGSGINAISAHGVGSDAKGQFEAANLGFHAQVTCLEVVGNDAIATAVIDHSHDPGNPVGEVIVIEGVDNGNPSGGTSPDLMRVSFSNNGGVTLQPGPCQVPNLPPAPVESGNIVVMPG